MTCADVCIDMDPYGETNDLHDSRTHRARVEHRCCECHRTILRGERYEYVSALSDGHFWAAKTCAECVGIRAALVCGSWIYGDLWEAVEEEVFPVWQRTGPYDCLAKIELVSARRLLEARFAAWREGH
jgi:hypothetical protein